MPPNMDFVNPGYLYVNTARVRGAVYLVVHRSLMLSDTDASYRRAIDHSASHGFSLKSRQTVSTTKRVAGGKAEASIYEWKPRVAA